MKNLEPPNFKRTANKNNTTMSPHELFEQISVWKGFYEQPLLPMASNPDVYNIRTMLETKWYKELFYNASQLIVIDILVGSPAEQPLAMAIELAHIGDSKSLPEIYRLLVDVKKYMYEHGLY
ncbi:MAG: hypothetical protein WC976_05920 [Caldisericia bacterium]